MPNQRAKNKKHIGGFVPLKLDREIKGTPRGNAAQQFRGS